MIRNGFVFCEATNQGHDKQKPAVFKANDFAFLSFRIQ